MFKPQSAGKLLRSTPAYCHGGVFAAEVGMPRTAFTLVPSGAGAST